MRKPSKRDGKIEQKSIQHHLGFGMSDAKAAENSSKHRSNNHLTMDSKCMKNHREGVCGQGPAWRLSVVPWALPSCLLEGSWPALGASGASWGMAWEAS